MLEILSIIGTSRSYTKLRKLRDTLNNQNELGSN